MMTIKEAMKKINLLQQQIDNLVYEESQNNFSVYVDPTDKDESDYNLNHTTKAIEVLQEEILFLRRKINAANIKTSIGIEDYSISDALVKIAQLSSNANRYLTLSQQKQRTRNVTYNGVIEVTEMLFDVKEAYEKYLEVSEKIHALQTAIDKANILTEI